jgi:hypothetical protein
MTITIHLLLIVIALVLFAMAGLGVPEWTRLRFIGWGLFLWLLSTMVRR